MGGWKILEKTMSKNVLLVVQFLLAFLILASGLTGLVAALVALIVVVIIELGEQKKQ